MVTRCGYWGWILGLTALLSSTDRALSEDFVSVGGSFLTFYAKAMTFPDAVATCAKIGAHVVNDDDPLVHAYLTKNGKLQWIGATDEGHEGDWKWINSGASVGASHWYPDEPNNLDGIQHCVVINFGYKNINNNGLWDDQPCNLLRPFHCQTDWIKVGNKFFKFYEEKKTYAAAARTCIQVGGHIAYDDNPLVHAHLVKNGRLQWIGATDQGHEGEWQWMNSGASVGAGHWYQYEPNNFEGNQNCAVINYAVGKPDGLPNGLWDDQQCDLERSFHCQVRRVPK